MPIQKEKRPLLSGALPDFAYELQQLLTAKGEPGLAAQVPRLAIHDRCACGDDFCSTFYVKPKPEGSFGPNLRNVRLIPDDGALLVLDVVDGEIRCVELLDRPEIRKMLDAALPNDPMPQSPKA